MLLWEVLLPIEPQILAPLQRRISLQEELPILPLSHQIPSCSGVLHDVEPIEYDLPVRIGNVRPRGLRRSRWDIPAHESNQRGSASRRSLAPSWSARGWTVMYETGR